MRVVDVETVVTLHDVARALAATLRIALTRRCAAPIRRVTAQFGPRVGALLAEAQPHELEVFLAGVTLEL